MDTKVKQKKKLMDNVCELKTKIGFVYLILKVRIVAYAP